MTWNADRRLASGGYWRCLVKRSEHNKRRHEQRVAWMREDRAASPRQYIYARRRALAGQRERIQTKLLQLRREAENSNVPQP